jgi:hypothetical protein
MDAQIEVRKIDHGQYDDQFKLTIKDIFGRQISVNISEYDYEALKKKFTWLIKEQPFPAQEREILS